MAQSLSPGIKACDIIQARAFGFRNLIKSAYGEQSAGEVISPDSGDLPRKLHTPPGVGVLESRNAVLEAAPNSPTFLNLVRGQLTGNE